MTHSKRIARLPSSLDFDKLIGKDDQAGRENLAEKYNILLKNTDLLLDIIRQLTDINDEDRGIGEKLQNTSYRRFAFRQITRYVNVCLNDLTQVNAMIDEDFMTSRLQRMGEMIKKVMESWDIMFHGIEVIVKNPNICTSLPAEIKLFHDLSAIDMEEFIQCLGPLKDEIASRMSFCQLNSREEYNICMNYSLKQFRLDSFRFDKLILTGDCERSTSEEENKVDIENKKMEKEEDKNNEENELEIKTNIKRMRSCKSNNSEATMTAIRPNIMIDTSCNDTYAYDSDPSDGCVIGKSISREDFKSKHNYIKAWAECQSETCLNRDSADSINSISGEDMDLDVISVEEKFSDDCSEVKSFVAAASQLPSGDAKVSTHLGHSQSTQIHCKTQNIEVEPLSSNVYTDCLKSVASDHIKKPTQPIQNTINKGLIRTHEESKRNLSSELKCDDKMSSQSAMNTVDSNDIAHLTQGCNEQPKKEPCQISHEILPGQESHIISDDTKARQSLKITLIHKGCGIWAVKTSNKRKRSESESENCTDSTNDAHAILEGRSNQHCKRVKLSLDEDSSSKYVKLMSVEDSSSQNAKLTLTKNVKHGAILDCGIWAVKTSNKRKRFESESHSCTDSTNDAPAILEGRSNQHCKRVKLTLNEDSSSKYVKLTLAEDSSFQNAKLTLAKNLKHEHMLGSGTGMRAFKKPNKRKRSESESDNCTNWTNDALAIIEQRANQSCKVPKMAKLTLAKDSSSKNAKNEPTRKTKFKSLRRLATAICAMKSRMISRPMLRRVATIRPFLI